MVLRQKGTPAACAARAAWISPSRQNRPVRPVGAGATGMAHASPSTMVCAVESRHIDHDALAQRDRAQVVAIARPGALVVGAAVDVVEQRARQSPLRELAQIRDAGTLTEGHAPLPPGRAATTWRWLPSFSMPSSMTSPTLRKMGSGLMPMPTPGGVPVVMTSPGCRLMNWLR